MKKFVAHYASSDETKTFRTFEEAKIWLEKMWEEDGPVGFSEGSCCGDDYIAEITHVSKFEETDRRENYSWCDKRGGYFIGDEEWPYSDVFEFMGKIILKEVEE